MATNRSQFGIRASALIPVAVAAAGAIVALVAWARTPVPGPIDDTRHEASAASAFSGCLTEIDGTVWRLQIGEEIETPRESLSCQTYDGYPVVVHSGVSRNQGTAESRD